MSATPAVQTEIQSTTYRVDGPQLEPNSLSFVVQLLYYVKTERDTATITVGDGTWDLVTQVVTLTSGGRELSSTSRDLALGESARQIFEAMLTPADVTIRKRGQAQPTAGVTRTPTPVPEPENVIVETRTTLFAAEAKKFQQCVDGARSARRPAAR